MGLYESAAPLGGVPLITVDDRSIGYVFKRCREWMVEFPGLVRGLYELARPFRWHLAVLLGFNACIAAWETIQPMILAWGVDTFAAKVPFIEMVAIIVYPILTIAIPHGVILPLFRDMYELWFIKPQFEKYVSLLCLKRSHSGDLSTHPEVLGRRAPVAQEGRTVAYGLIAMLVRDPAFALRGLVVFVVLSWMSPPLLALLLFGIVADLLITLIMDARLFRPYALQQEHEFRVRGLEFKLLDGTRDETSDASQKHAEYSDCAQAWDHYVGATRFAEMRRMIFQTPIRETVSQLVRIGSMVLVAWWVHTDQVSVGEYIFFVQLAGRANDPLYVFLGFQSKFMTTRESVRRLGLLTGIDFGLAKPGTSATA
jgi:ABC-type multidrug transport system fused ATPase/permease subunit